MAGVITVNFKVVKNGMKDLGLKSPIYIPGPVEPQFGAGRHIYFEGFSVDEHGKQHYSKSRYRCRYSPATMSLLQREQAVLLLLVVRADRYGCSGCSGGIPAD